MTLVFGATTVSIVCLLKLLPSSNVKDSTMRVAVHVIFSAFVLDLKEN